MNERTLRWTIASLGTTQTEGASVTFTVQHNGSCSGPLAVNESITFRNDEGNVVDFDEPVIDVDSGEDVFPEACPEPVDIKFRGGQDALEFDAGDIELILILD